MASTKIGIFKMKKFVVLFAGSSSLLLKSLIDLFSIQIHGVKSAGDSGVLVSHQRTKVTKQSTSSRDRTAT
jgi:hypothetical protein